MKVIKLLALSLFLSACAIPTNEVKDDLGYEGRSSNGTNQVIKQLNKLKSDPDVKISMHEGWTIAESQNNMSLWSFAPESHPAYPSFAKRSPVEKDGSVFIRTQVTCGAEKSVCDSFVKDFIKLNEQVKEYVNSQ